MRPSERSHRARRGFTLIELLAVILIIGILMAFLVPQIPAAIDRAEVTACRKNLGVISEALIIHYNKYKELPSESGARFVASPITRKVWENTKQNAERLTCPGVSKAALANQADHSPDEWFADPELIDGQSTSYAGRDLKNHPLRKFPGSGKEPLIADDNDGGMNHKTETCVLYADGTVGTLDLVTLEEQGVLGKDELLLVGADSQVEELTKLSLD
jgi:general secretion pathway protein G